MRRHLSRHITAIATRIKFLYSKYMPNIYLPTMISFWNYMCFFIEMSKYISWCNAETSWNERYTYIDTNSSNMWVWISHTLFTVYFCIRIQYFYSPSLFSSLFLFQLRLLREKACVAYERIFVYFTNWDWKGHMKQFPIKLKQG